MNRVELIMRRRNVKAFIEADPVIIEFSRNGESVKTAAGGYVRSAPASLPPQMARIVQNKRRYNNGIVNSEAGDIPHTDYLLIGNHTLDIAEEDEFTWLGEYYKVTGIHKARTESVLASIDLLGEVNRHAE